MHSRHLGQHFLINHFVVQREIEYAHITSKDVVLEIGPGKGVLTRILAEKAKKVIAIELDGRLISYLQSILPDNVDIIHADAVRYDFSLLPRFTKVVSNLPYQISSPITFKLLSFPFERAVLIYQKEFAARMIAHCGDSEYSRLSVGVYYKALCSMLEVVPPGCFYPKPLVDSAIVELIPRKKPPFHVANERFFFDITNLLFNHRRKKIGTVLSKHYGLSSEQIPFCDMRIEMLSPEQIGELSNYVLGRIATQ